MKILVIDDEEDLVDMISIYLEERYNVSTATSAAKGMFEFKRNSFDCLIVDINMPKKDGPTLIKEIRETGFEKPVIFISGEQTEALMKRVLSLNAFDFILKPFSKDDLLKILEDAEDEVKEIENLTSS